jgi:GNAT superfamily N-acetyltransferase
MGTVFTAARAAMRYLPQLHSAAEDMAFFAGVASVGAAEGCQVEVAEAGGVVVAFSAVHADWLDHLYVDPGWQGRGLGGAFLARAQAARPGGLQLWVFEPNVGAQRLYAGAGFVEVERTDGRGNIEGVPDIKMRWPGLG